MPIWTRNQRRSRQQGKARREKRRLPPRNQTMAGGGGAQQSWSHLPNHDIRRGKLRNLEKRTADETSRNGAAPHRSSKEVAMVAATGQPAGSMHYMAEPPRAREPKKQRQYYCRPSSSSSARLRFWRRTRENSEPTRGRPETAALTGAGADGADGFWRRTRENSESAR